MFPDYRMPTSRPPFIPALLTKLNPIGKFSRSVPHWPLLNPHHAPLLFTYVDYSFNFPLPDDFNQFN